jgi:diadenosine tetraphosphate (Ap4A) HIT family hydrolase
MPEDREEKCNFLRHRERQGPAHRVYESEHALVILDIHPYTRGHCLVLSKKHVPWWHQLTGEETADLFRAANTVANRMMKTYNPDFVFLYARGRRIPHTHIFLIPTYGGTSWTDFSTPWRISRSRPSGLAALKDPALMAQAARELRRGGLAAAGPRDPPFLTGPARSRKIVGPHVAKAASMTEPSRKANVRVLFALTLIHFTGDFYNAFTTPLLPVFAGVFALSLTEVGIISGLGRFLSFVVQPNVGYFADRFTPGSSSSAASSCR